MGQFRVKAFFHVVSVLGTVLGTERLFYAVFISLDEDRRRIVLSDEDYTLVIAGAGAGKTTTVAAKVKYLVDKKDIDPKKILVISFTDKAVSFVSLVIIYRHHMNIVRIAKGTEFSLYDTFGKKKKEENEA